MIKDNVLQTIGDELKDSLIELGRGLGQEAIQKADELAQYAAARADHLSRAVGEPGFDQAVKAEAHALALKAGISAVELGDAADAAKLDGLRRGLSMAARMLAALL